MNTSEGKRSATYKILVAGHFNAGKTTFIKTISSGKALSTEKKTYATEEALVKDLTTTAMDYGRIKIGKWELSVYGIPGQERFSFMWDVLSKRTDAYIFMVDSSDPSRWEETLKQMDRFLSKTEAPYVICANKTDLPSARPVEEVRDFFSHRGGRVVPCVAKQRDSALLTLVVALYELTGSEKLLEVIKKFMEV